MSQDAPMLGPGPPGRAKRYSWLGQLYRYTADLTDLHAETHALVALGCDEITVGLDRPGSRSHARWRVSWLQDGHRRDVEASGARIALERARRAAGGLT